MARRFDFGEAVKARISELVESAKKDIIDKAVASLVEHGAEVQTENLRIDFEDQNGKKLLSLVLSGKLRIEPPKEEE